MPTSNKVQKDVWRRWSDANGTYFYFEVKVNLWVDVVPASDESYYDVTFYSEFVPGSWKEQYDISGGGFVDCYGLFWDPGSSVGKSVRSSGRQDLTVAQGRDNFMSGLQSIGYSSSDPTKWCIAGVAIDNMYHNIIRFGEGGTSYTKRFTKAQYENINNEYMVLGVATRWLDQSTNEAVVSMEGYELKWNELFPDWIPWSVYYEKKGDNYSCNRKTSAETSTPGTLRVYTAKGESHIATNGGDEDHAWCYYEKNKPTQSPKFGRFMDE